VLLSAGIGITPMIAMLNGLLVNGNRTRHRHPIYFIHGARNRREHAFAAHLQTMAAGHRNLSVHVRYSDEAAPFDSDITNWQGSAGRIDIDLLRELLPFGDYDFYLCGPASFMQQMYDGLRGLNIADVRIRFEAFGPASVRRDTCAEKPAIETRPAATAQNSTTAVAVQFTRSGVTAQWDGSHANLLALAEANGIPAESSCRNGQCGACAVALTSGEVRYIRECDAHAGAGEVLMCSAVPAAGVESITLDL
jgi:ferredoxin-NADP reductase